MDNEYQLVIRIPYNALDDMQARQMAREMMKVTTVPDETVVKLQRLEDGKEPSIWPHREQKEESARHSLQQLKAEIAATVLPAIVALRNGDMVAVGKCIDELRRLSAV